MTAAPNEAALRRDAHSERLRLAGLGIPALILVAGIMLVPVAWLFWLSFLSDDGALSLEHYRRLVEQPSYRRILLATFQVSAMVTLVCVLLGYPLAYVLSQLPRRVAAICMIGVLMPFWTSILVRTYAWLVLLQRRGLINEWGRSLGLWDEPLQLVYSQAGTVIGLAHVLLPFLVLPLYSSMRAIDPACLRAAANLGATPTQAFWQVFVPLSLPGLLAGALLVFIVALGSYVTPAILGGGKVVMVANAIANDIQLFFNSGAASALGAVLLLVTAAILWAAARMVGARRLFGHGA